MALRRGCAREHHRRGRDRGGGQGGPQDALHFHLCFSHTPTRAGAMLTGYPRGRYLKRT